MIDILAVMSDFSEHTGRNLSGIQKFMKIAFYTLGCKANQFDTQAMETLALSRGHSIVPFEAEADAYVINTCTVTAESDRKSRQIIRAARRSAPQACVAVCGCFSQVSPGAALALGADLVCGTRERAAVIEQLESACAQKQPLCEVSPYQPGLAFEPLPAGGYAGRTRALLKIEEGCDNYCSYCIIPYSRGHIRSLPLSDAAIAARELAAEGYREIVLTGIEISSYGHDFKDGTGLIHLLETLCGAVPEMRIHLGSLEPRTITRDFCIRSAALPGVLPHFHLSLQSGCDATLARMRRRYDTARFLESVNLLREFFPNCGITTDLITGFPGETEDEFAHTLAFLEICRFSQMHVFPYSSRPGTPAAKMPQLSRAIKQERAHKAAEAGARMHRDFLHAQIGRTLSVLFEEPDGDTAQGHSENYLPVCITNAPALRAQVCPVHIDTLRDGKLYGHLTDRVL